MYIIWKQTSVWNCSKVTKGKKLSSVYFDVVTSFMGGQDSWVTQLLVRTAFLELSTKDHVAPLYHPVNASYNQHRFYKHFRPCLFYSSFLCWWMCWISIGFSAKNIYFQNFQVTKFLGNDFPTAASKAAPNGTWRSARAMAASGTSVMTKINHSNCAYSIYGCFQK